MEEKHSLEDYDSWQKKKSSYSEDIDEEKSLECVLAAQPEYLSLPWLV